MASIHDFTMKTIDGKEQSLGDYRGKALLVVNVASKCGLTPQYESLQALHSEYGPRGFAAFCSTSYGVTFPMYSKIDVNGKNRAPLYDWLTGQATKPDGSGDIKWNFAKFVVGKDGAVAARFDPKTAPSAPEVRQAIEQALRA